MSYDNAVYKSILHYITLLFTFYLLTIILEDNFRIYRWPVELSSQCDQFLSQLQSRKSAIPQSSNPRSICYVILMI